MKTKRPILWVFLATFLTVVAIAHADTTIYDKNYNVQGHKKESGGTTTVYDKNWNRTGYEKGDKIYDKNWNVKGYKKTDGQKGRSDSGRHKEK